MLGYIIKKKYHHSNKQEYDEALSCLEIEKQFYKKHFNIDITGYSFDYPSEFHEETNMNKKVHMRIQTVLEMAIELEKIKLKIIT